MPPKSSKKKKHRPATKKKPESSRRPSRPRAPRAIVDRHQALVVRPPSAAHTPLAQVARQSQADSDFARQWSKSIKDPFGHVPQPLGTATGSLTFTNTFSGLYPFSGTPASKAFMMLPRSQTAFCVGTGTSGAVAWSSNAMNGDSQLANYSQGRIVGAGLSYTIKMADTDVPGDVYGGLIPVAMATEEITSMTIPQITNSPYLTLIDGRNALTGQVTWRPFDAQDAEFDTSVTADSGLTIRTTTVPFLFFTGWTAYIQVRVTAIMHVEVVPNASQFMGVPVSLSTSEHDWGVIVDHMKSYMGTAFNIAFTVGSRALLHAAGSYIRGALGSIGSDNKVLNDDPFPKHVGHVGASSGPAHNVFATEDGTPFPPEGYFTEPGLVAWLEQQAALRIAAIESRLDRLEQSRRSSIVDLGNLELGQLPSSSNSSSTLLSQTSRFIAARRSASSK